MLLGIPGDNTYSNYQEAQRAFWRQTLLPLANRRLKPDLDQIEALSGERDALWARLQGVSFISDDEQRVAAGYGSKAIRTVSARDRSPGWRS